MNSIWAPIVSIAFLVASIPTLGVVPVEYEDSAELNLMTVVPVSDGTSVTIYERTGDWFILTYTVATLSGAGGKFDSAANEHYTFTTDGTYLISDCYRPYSTGGGHNIVAARLNGVPEYPDGIWIGEVVSYILGRDGIPESRFNALGEHMENHTRFGDENSQLVFAFLVESAPTEIEAEVECGPQTLNLGSYLYDTLLSPDARKRGFFNAEYVEKILDKHMRGVRNHSDKLWCLLNFELWNRLYIDPEKPTRPT